MASQRWFRRLFFLSEPLAAGPRPPTHAGRYYTWYWVLMALVFAGVSHGAYACGPNAQAMFNAFPNGSINFGEPSSATFTNFAGGLDTPSSTSGASATITGLDCGPSNDFDVVFTAEAGDGSTQSVSLVNCALTLSDTFLCEAISSHTPGLFIAADHPSPGGTITSAGGGFTLTSGSIEETSCSPPCASLTVTANSLTATGKGLKETSTAGDLSRRNTLLKRLFSGVFGDTLTQINSISRGFRPLLGIGSLRLGPGGGSFAKRGLGAGEWTYPVGIWGNFGYTSSENDFVSVASDSKSLHGTLGADMTVNDWLVVGMAAGYENDDIDTSFNGGNIDSDAFTVVGYAAALVNDEVSVDVAVGRSALDNDQFRIAGGARVTSSFDSDRTFLSGNVNYGRSFGDMRFTGTAGIVWAKDAADAFTESDGTAVASSDFIIGRAKLRGEFSALYGDWEPFISAAYNRSFTETDQVFAAGVADPGQDKTDVLLGFGARYFGSEGMSGLVEFTSVLGRDHVEQYSISAIIRAEF